MTQLNSRMDMDAVWWRTLLETRDGGTVVSPRGKRTMELPQRTITVDMTRPVVTIPGRKISYQFMAAEAYWILSGDDRVDGIAPWNKHISDFSDDGVSFFGAYGPKIMDQLEYVIDKLVADRDTRQAGLTIWREKPPETKDVPCTVAIFFSVRQGKLNCHVFMRSSDVWLGVPYDVFNFSMLGHYVCAHLGKRLTHQKEHITPGNLYLTAASSHLYEINYEAAEEVFLNPPGEVIQPQVPPQFSRYPTYLMQHLKELRESKPGDTNRWWESR